MPDIEGILKTINTLSQSAFGQNTPPLIRFLALALLIFCLALGVYNLLALLSKIKDTWTKDFQPFFYSTELKRRQHYRRKFARHVEITISRLDEQEDWRDDRFTELEAEVEAEGRHKRSQLFPFSRQRNSLRHERSLSQAIAHSQERCIIVEGDPGSGKSVALRHVALQLASKAQKARHRDSIIPIYVNLKELECPPEAPVDCNLIEDFILNSLKRGNNRFVDDFLDKEFAKGIEQHTWFFLFDSFDEIPAILSSTETNDIIKKYSNAIADFLEDSKNQCRGVIASRQFRGPSHFNWPRFHILTLSEKRRRELVHKVDLRPEIELDLIGHLGVASDEIRTWTSNPLFLALLCEHMRAGKPFPENVHVVFNNYVEDRLKRDQGRLEKRYVLSIDKLRTTAEKIAFCMTADDGLGLSPTRAKLRIALQRQGEEDLENLDMLLDAIEYIKLARPDPDATADERRFTFAHRRFQEYFATCVVLRDLKQVSPLRLLTDGRWRETAVVMCQTQPIVNIRPLLAQAKLLLLSLGGPLPDLITDPVDYVQQAEQQTDQPVKPHTVKIFPWPDHTLSLLELLQDGLAGRLHEVPDIIRVWIGKIGLTATETGTLGDRKWALETAGLAPEAVFHYMLQKAFREPSQWLKDVAYRQVARPQYIKPAVEAGIRLAIVDMYRKKQLKQERYSVQTHVARLSQPAASNLLSVIRLFLALPWIYCFWHAFLLLYLAFCLLPYSHYAVRISIAVCITLLSYTLSKRDASRDMAFLCNSFAAFLLFMPDYFYQSVTHINLYTFFMGLQSYILHMVHTGFNNLLAHWQSYGSQIVNSIFTLLLACWNAIPWGAIPWKIVFILFLLLLQCLHVMDSSISSAERFRKANWLLYMLVPFYAYLLFTLAYLHNIALHVTHAIVAGLKSFISAITHLEAVAVDVKAVATGKKKKPSTLKSFLFKIGEAIILLGILAISSGIIILGIIGVKSLPTSTWNFLGTIFVDLILLSIGIVPCFSIFLLIKAVWTGKLTLQQLNVQIRKEIHALSVEIKTEVYQWIRVGMILLEDLRDKIAWVRQRKEWEKQLSQQSMDYQNFLSLISVYRTNKPKLLEIMTYTRQHQRLVPSREAEKELREFALEIEQGDSLLDISTLLDELYRLIEDIHARLPGK